MDPQRFPKYLQLGPWSLPKSFYLFHVLVTMITKDYNYFSYFQSMTLTSSISYSGPLLFPPFQSPKFSYQDGGSLDLLRFVQPKTSMVIIALISNVFNWRMDHLIIILFHLPTTNGYPCTINLWTACEFFFAILKIFFWQIISQSYP